MVLTLGAMPSWADVVVVKDRQPVAQVILKSDSVYIEVFAARELQYWISQMSGAKLPLVSTPAGQGPKIYIGAAFAQDFKDDLARLADNDGYAIRTRGGDVYVFGSKPRGTFYGVMALLEKNTDIIWARPNVQFGTVHGDHPTITLTQTDVLDIPVFGYRGFNGGHPPHPATEMWRLRNGDNLPNRGLTDPKWGLISYGSTDLSSPLWHEYDKHPEYFGFDPIKGQRVKPGYYSGALCLTHPDMATIWANAVVKEVRDTERKRGRPIEVYRITPGDNWGVCQCPTCLAPIKLPDGSTLEAKAPDAIKDPYFRSTQIAMLLNGAADILHRELPHVKFLVLAYIHMAEPPAVPVDPRYMIQLAPYPNNSMHVPLLDPRQPAGWRVRLEKWLKMAPNLGFFEYYYAKPSPQGYYAAANLRALAEGGRNTRYSFIYTEFNNDTLGGAIGGGKVGWDISAMNHWVVCKLFWNPNQDVDELYRHYITRTYREAAPQMLELFTMLRDSWLDPKNTTVDAAHASQSSVYNGLVIERGLESKVKDTLKRALAEVKHPSSRIHIERLDRQFNRLGQSLNRMVIAHQRSITNDGLEFNSLQWEIPDAMENFTEETRFGERKAAEQQTLVKTAHDGKTLYVRFYAKDTDIAKATARPKDDKELWTAGDHVELWFHGQSETFLFAIDCNGNTYDARNLDRSWNSGWKVKTQKNEEGWEAIVLIPLESVGLKPGQDNDMKWMIRREINHGREKPQWVSYTGGVLYRHSYPVVIE